MQTCVCVCARTHFYDLQWEALKINLSKIKLLILTQSPSLTKTFLIATPFIHSFIREKILSSSMCQALFQGPSF